MTTQIDIMYLAFANCTSLVNYLPLITNMANTQNIFANCTSLTNFSLPDSREEEIRKKRELRSQKLKRLNYENEN